MRWKELTPAQLDRAAAEIEALAAAEVPHPDEELDDVLRAIARHLGVEARRRAEEILSSTTPLTDADAEALGVR